MRKRIVAVLTGALALAAGGALIHIPSAGQGGVAFWSGVAFAEEDGGDDGDSDGGGGGGGSSGGGYGGGGNGNGGAFGVEGNVMPQVRRFFDRFNNSLQPRARSVQRRASPPPAPEPEFAERELTALGLDDDAITDLQDQGYVVETRTPIEFLDAELVRLIVPDGLSLEEARDAVRVASAGSVVDFNHFYRTEQDRSFECGGLHCPQLQLVNWREPAEACAEPARIGLIDTGINPDHSAFEEGSLTILDRFGEADAESGLVHGTAVAALLVGTTGDRVVGLLPGAEILAVDAFQSIGRDERATVFDLVRAIDMLISQDIAVLNMSLAGPPNVLLEKAMAATDELAIVTVAAAGNEGPQADPRYPAAYDNVIAVTAVDRNGRPYRRAGRGDHIDVAAPGVDVWTAASVSGHKPKTGTSFAAPFVTAAAALAKSAKPDLRSTDIEDMIAATAEDAGDPGKDPIFGWGLLDAAAFCEAPGAMVGTTAGDAGSEIVEAELISPQPGASQPASSSGADVE